MGAVEELAAAMRTQRPGRTLPGTVVEVLDATHVRVSIGDRAVKAFGVAPVGAHVTVWTGDNLTEVIAVHGFADWIAPTLAGTWVNFGGGMSPAGYRLRGDTVEVRGNVKSGSGTIFTLPMGYRPAAGSARYIVPAGPGAAIVDVRWDGPVNLVSYLASGTSAHVALDGISFPLA